MRPVRPFTAASRALLTVALCGAPLLADQPSAAPAHGVRPAPGDAAAVLDTAIARMGGAELLRGLVRARFEMITQWQRTAFDARPSADAPSYEWHTDQRDYALSAWRNTRRFPMGGVWREITDVVRDSVAIRRAPGGGGVASPASAATGAWAPLNVAYVDERRELFALAPERLLLAARAAADLRALPDTQVAGVAHARVAATVDRFPMVILVRRTDGYVAAAGFRAAAPNDFGLVPWGEMDVALWYSGWRRLPNGVAYPHQWDVTRVGRAYKRVTLLAATFNPPAMPDSFAIGDSLRGAYLATATRPMHDVPLDSARLVDGRFASFATPGAPAGAVKLGRQWVLLESGQAPLSAERAAAWLARTDAGARVAAALVTLPLPGSGGAAWLAARRIPVHATPGVAPFVAAVLRGHRERATGVTAVPRGRWLRVDGDSLWIEPIDLPDAPGAMVVYAPSLGWAYSGMAASPLQLDLVLAHARARGWRVSRVGSARAVATPLPPAMQLPAAVGAAVRR